MPDTPPFGSDILRRLPPLEATPVARGFQRDALGVLCRLTYKGGAATDPGQQMEPPRPDDWEWIPLVWSAMTARHSMVAVELGAGWGPWVSRSYALARALGLASCHLYAVEAEPAHFDYLQTHLKDNAIPDEDCRLVQGLVTEQSGYALFPLTETPETSWGLRQVGRESQNLDSLLSDAGAELIAGSNALYRLPKSPYAYAVQRAVSLADLIGDVPRVDFLHADIQGSEAHVFPSSMGVLDARVRVVAIGTHGHDIEDALRVCFAGRGWVCHHDTPMWRTRRGKLRDGHQVWVNPRFDPQPDAPTAG